MGTIQSPAMLPGPRITRLTPQSVEMLETRIRAAEAEANFYCKMLSWLLFNCNEQQRPVIETFRAEMLNFRSKRLQGLIEGVNKLKIDMNAGGALIDWQTDMAHLQLYCNHVENMLQSLKSNIQGRFSDFIHVCIW